MSFVQGCPMDHYSEIYFVVGMLLLRNLRELRGLKTDLPIAPI